MTSQPLATGVTRIIFIGLGFLFTGLGVIGAILPLVPSVVFFLLAAYFFSRSSERFHSWLLNHKIIGGYIRNYQDKRGMSGTDKLVTLGVMWLSAGISCVVIPGFVPAKIGLVTVLAGVSIYIIRLKTLEKGPVQPS